MGARTTFAREDEERPSVELNVREEVRRGSPYLNGKWRCFLSFPFAFSLQEQRSANSGAGRLPPPGPAAPPKRRRQVSPPSLSLTRPNHALFPVGEKPQQKRKAHASWRDKAWRAPRAEKERFRLEGLGFCLFQAQLESAAKSLDLSRCLAVLRTSGVGGSRGAAWKDVVSVAERNEGA